jgi:hypothetical protein
MARTTIGILSALCASLSLGSEMTAQGALKDRFGALLPSDAKIIEAANLNIRAGRARVLVLWMSNPKRVMAYWNSGPDFV